MTLASALGKWMGIGVFMACRNLNDPANEGTRINAHFRQEQF
jgi:hypothetical protein